MRNTHLLVVLAACACPPEKKPEPATPKVVEAPKPPEPVKPPEPSPEEKLIAEANTFVKGLDAQLRTLNVEASIAQWANETDITDEHEAAASKAGEHLSVEVTKLVKEARKFDPIIGKLDPDARRMLYLLKFQATPSPDDPAKAAALAKIGTEMDSLYGKGVCTTDPKTKKESCKIVDEYSKILQTSHKPAELLAAWKTWTDTIGHEERDDFAKFVDLANEGARGIGFADISEQWKGGYDMPPDAFEADVDRLWNQVKPLYDNLHCYARRQLNKKYGDKIAPKTGPIPSHLLGNMWAQTWDYIYPDLEPFKGVASIDVTPKLEKMFPEKPDALKSAKEMVKVGEAFYTSIGFDPLPATFWERSMFIKPEAPRKAVCHASAWDVQFNDDLRIKMCIKPNQEDLWTIHHELGHDFYFQHYYNLPVIYQQGANDGFHEAIGDTIQLSMTPEYLKQKGLLDKVVKNDKATINAQMKVALGKVAFLPFGLMVDKWRWDVFSGKVKPDQYNQHWWDLKLKYQGVAPPVPRSATDFDPGAKYHVAANVPYMRYFLAAVLQFQFHRALCKKAGFTGPLNECSIYGNKEAGMAYAKMLAMGASKPWQDALEELTGQRDMDASAILEYFAPLQKWLEEQNKGQACGW